MNRKYASCECELCNEIIPKNEAHYEDIVEETGSWQGNSSGYSSNSGSSYSYYSKGGSRSSNRSSRGRRSGNSTRTYYRNRRVWFCESCYSDLLEERKEQEEKEKKMREQSRQQSNTIFLYCFYIFSALSIFVYLIS